MSNMKAAIICGIVILAAAVVVWQQHQGQVASQAENLALRQEVNALSAENAVLSNQVSQAAAPGAEASSQERVLMRLRSEVGTLKKQLADAAKLQAQLEAKAQAARPAVSQTAEPPDPYREMAISKMNFAKRWVLAFQQYSQQHDGQLPADFESAAQFVPPGTEADPATTGQYEIAYRGVLNEITNPQSIIVIREKQAWQTPDGGWAKGYGFADGHSEIHKTTDGNFQPWEAQHLAGAAQGQ